MPIILFLNIKGGVAKTTTAVAVSEALAEMGHRVLLIDADHQCASSELLLGETRFMAVDHGHRTLHDLLAAMLNDHFDTGQIRSFVASGASNVLTARKKLSCIPCSFRINEFQTNMAKARRGFKTSEEFDALFRRRENAFRAWLNSEFDFTIVDCPPSIDIQVRLFLRMGHGFVIPCVPDRISVRGARWLLEYLAKKGLTIRALGLVWTLYRDQNARHKRTIGMVRSSAGRTKAFAALPQPFNAVVPNATAIVAANEFEGTTGTVSSKYTSPFAKVFDSLAREILVSASRSG